MIKEELFKRWTNNKMLLLADKVCEDLKEVVQF